LTTVYHQWKPFKLLIPELKNCYKDVAPTATGDLSMEVLCYIWDQCFIGLNCGPDYQCLPYFITAWLILLREKLMACHSVRDFACP